MSLLLRRNAPSNNSKQPPHTDSEEENYNYHNKNKHAVHSFSTWKRRKPLLLVIMVALVSMSSAFVWKRIKTAKLKHKHKHKHKQKAVLHILALRHSGSNWITRHLKECFGNQTVKTRYAEFKHWFQDYEEWEPRHPGRRHVVLAQFRHPLHWTLAMRAKPYHSPAHFDLDWREFVTKPWTMPRYDQDVQYEGVTAETAPLTKCRGQAVRKRAHQVIPCDANASFAVGQQHGKKGRALYELRRDGSGRPYDNVLQLRAAKIRNFMELSPQQHDSTRSLHAFLHVRYEDLVRRGTGELVSQLERALGISAQCRAIPGRPEWQDPRRVPDDEYVDYMKEHVDWSAEALVGYAPPDDLDRVELLARKNLNESQSTARATTSR